ncbi:MAG: hypothetical protein ACK4SR_10570 [Thiobacillus sp.]
MTERLLAARVRLAFWRKPAAPAVATGANTAETPEAPTASPSLSAEARAGDATAAETSVTAAPDEARLAPPPSRLARWLGRLRQRAANTASLEALTPAGHEGEDADAADRPAPSRRVLAMLARKSVWMPAAGLAVLALIGTLGAMLWQAGQRNAALQARLEASEKKLAPARSAPAARPDPAKAAPRPVESSPVESRIAGAGTVTPAKSAPAGGDCDIGGREGVTLHLKDCIDAFNQGRAGAGRGSR